MSYPQVMVRRPSRCLGGSLAARWSWTVVVVSVLNLAASAAFAQAASNPPPALRPVNHASRTLPEWLSLGAAYRFRAEGRTGLGFSTGSEAYGLSRLLVSVGVQPVSWFKLSFQGQDARAPGKDNATAFFRDPFDVRQAYVELGDLAAHGVSVRAGRQELLFGAQRLVGPLNWGNTSRQFDAVKLSVGSKDMSVDVFASSLVRTDPSGLNRSWNGVNLHGIYGKLNKLIPKATFEPYVLWKTQPVRQAGSPVLGDANIYTAGFRFVRPLPAGFDVAAEVAPQFGTFGARDISALGAYGILGYSPPGWASSPRFSFEFTYASGSDGPDDDKQRTFDQLFPTAHLYLGIADRVGWRNTRSSRGGVELKPHRKVSVKFDFHSFWLANSRDHLYGAGGQVLVAAPAGGASSSHVGEEVDVVFTFKPADHVTIGAGYGYLFPGDFLKQNTPGNGTSFPYIFLNYVL